MGNPKFACMYCGWARRHIPGKSCQQPEWHDKNGCRPANKSTTAVQMEGWVEARLNILANNTRMTRAQLICMILTKAAQDAGGPT